jgi:hypothetical protein
MMMMAQQPQMQVPGYGGMQPPMQPQQHQPQQSQQPMRRSSNGNSFDPFNF